MTAAQDPGQSPIKVERVGGLGGVPPGLIAVFAIVIVAIAVAWLKPWGAGGPVHGDGGLAAFAFATPPPPAPTGDPRIEAAVLRALCNRPTGWRLISMETSALGDTRTMYGIDPAPASGPLDATIPTARLSADRLFGIGVCSPFAGANPNLPSPVQGVTIWSVPLVGAGSLIDHTTVLDQALNDLGEAYFGPPRPQTDPLIAGNSNPVWPPGRYAVEIDRGGANGVTLWFALDFVLASRG